MPLSSTRPSSVMRPAGALLACLVLVLAAVGFSERPGAAAGLPERAEQLRFMWAMAGQESGWDYYARNSISGAFGKYQIMPANWPVWAERYLGDREADQTPWNQERVAYGKLRDLHAWLGSWKRVAYWWLTGSTEQDSKQWSGYAKGYVRNIMALRKKAPADLGRMPDRTSSRAQPGDWRRSATEQRLRIAPAGGSWPRRGRIDDGEVLKVRAGRTLPSGQRWVRVLTADGRLGWLRQARTVPARAPAQPARWRDVTDEGRPLDRRTVRPIPR